MGLRGTSGRVGVNGEGGWGLADPSLLFSLGFSLPGDVLRGGQGEGEVCGGKVRSETEKMKIDKEKDIDI